MRSSLNSGPQRFSQTLWCAIIQLTWRSLSISTSSTSQPTAPMGSQTPSTTLHFDATPSSVLEKRILPDHCVSHWSPMLLSRLFTAESATFNNVVLPLARCWKHFPYRVGKSSVSTNLSLPTLSFAISLARQLVSSEPLRSKLSNAKISFGLLKPSW